MVTEYIKLESNENHIDEIPNQIFILKNEENKMKLEMRIVIFQFKFNS